MHDRERLPHGVVIVLRRGERFLFIERGDVAAFSGYWCPPAGKVEAGESAAEAVTREAEEEIGVRVRPLREIGECLSAGGRYWLRWWLAEVVEGEPRIASDEVADLAWLTLEEVRAMDRIFEKDLELLERFLRGAP